MVDSYLLTAFPYVLPKKSYSLRQPPDSAIFVHLATLFQDHLCTAKKYTSVCQTVDPFNIAPCFSV
jgi:hypothetical protein